MRGLLVRRKEKNRRAEAVHSSLMPGDKHRKEDSENSLRCKFQKLKRGQLSQICTAMQGDHLVRLELCSVGLQPADAKLLAWSLRGNATLRALEVGGNSGFGDAGVSELAPGLCAAEALLCLGLDSCGISNVGGLILASVLLQRPALSSLKLQHNKLADDAAVDIARAIEACK